MPTPSDLTLSNPLDQVTPRPTCPPEQSTPPSAQSPLIAAASLTDRPEDAAQASDHSDRTLLSTPPVDADRHVTPVAHPKRMDIDDEAPLRDTPSPLSNSEDASECDQRSAQSHTTAPSTPSSGFEGSPWPRERFLPNSTSSFLRPGSKFRGTQQSDRQVYDVQVEIQYVDMEEHCLCGYLRIQGLTDDHPTLTTYFEGEIIGTKHTFQTNKPEWGSNEKVDMQHWGRFPAWKPLAKQAKRSDFTYKNFAQRENLFMRWKEHFLVPDHTVRTISGASFEGFYYICFSQVTGKINGIYFHAKSEKFQQLELEHVDDHGCMGAIEFR